MTLAQRYEKEMKFAHLINKFQRSKTLMCSNVYYDSMHFAFRAKVTVGNNNR